MNPEGVDRHLANSRNPAGRERLPALAAASRDGFIEREIRRYRALCFALAVLTLPAGLTGAGAPPHRFIALSWGQR